MARASILTVDVDPDVTTSFTLPYFTTANRGSVMSVRLRTVERARLIDPTLVDPTYRATEPQVGPRTRHDHRPGSRCGR